MAYEALITLDLSGQVSDQQRADFYAFLDKLEWEKLPELTTAWTCSFPADVSREDAISELEADVSEACAYASIKRCHVAVQLSKEDIDLFYV